MRINGKNGEIARESISVYGVPRAHEGRKKRGGGARGSIEWLAILLLVGCDFRSRFTDCVCCEDRRFFREKKFGAIRVWVARTRALRVRFAFRVRVLIIVWCFVQPCVCICVPLRFARFASDKVGLTKEISPATGLQALAKKLDSEVSEVPGVFFFVCAWRILGFAKNGKKGEIARESISVFGVERACAREEQKKRG